MSNKLTKESVIQRKTDVVHSAFDEETVLMDVAGGSYYKMGDVASKMWSLIEEPCSVESICKTICSEYDVDEATCLKDALKFLGDCINTGIAEVVDKD